ncbi:MAG: MerR family transcriptional regulator [Saprospiraceae bacterium]|nr:MerR family transcriptional regulator [Saprospiraceae bacterium]
MPRPKLDPEKRYYSISEVAAMFGVSTSLIRFWENEFEMLKPHKNSKGDRRFTPENIDQFQQIYHLVKERGFTLNGAKQELKHLKDWERQKEQMLGLLKKVRKSLEDIRKELNGAP